MGCDGGVLAMQRKFMRGMGVKLNDKVPEEVSRRLRALIRSRCCAVSNEELRDPIVACELGHLYNKEAVLMALLERTLNPAFQHIRGMKDLILCRFTPNPNNTEENGGGGGGGSSESNEAKGSEAAGASVGLADGEPVPRFICPVTRVEMNAKQPFAVLRTTGWVLSERALREIGAANLQAEYGPFEADDVIRLVPEEDVEKELRGRMEERRAKAKSEKKEKKRKEREGEEGGGAGGEGHKEQRKEKRKEKHAGHGSNGGGKANGAGSGLSSAPMGLKVSSLAEEAKAAAEKNMASSSAFASLFNSGDNKVDKARLMSVRR